MWPDQTYNTGNGGLGIVVGMQEVRLFEKFSGIPDGESLFVVVATG